jgi:hypothetical protein
MSKRLILAVAFAFVAGAAMSAYAEVQNVKVSGDITAFGVMRELGFDNDNNDATSSQDKHQFMATTTRVKVDADLTDNVMTTVRLINERFWGSTSTSSQIDLDLAYVTLKEFLYSPATLTVGRQELQFGNQMIVGDGDANSDYGIEGDLSSRLAFDAVRLTLAYDPMIVDVIAAKVVEGTNNIADDQNLYGINANYRLNDKTMLEGYWFEKYTAPKTATLSNNKTDRVDTFGVRSMLSLTDALTLHGEGAVQVGKAVASGNTAKRRAYAFEGAAQFAPKDMKYTPAFTALYSYFSGSKGNGDKTARAWDPMFENQVFGDIADAQFPQSNVHLAGFIATAKPMDDVTLKGEYYLYWWDKRYGSLQSVTTLRGDTVIMKDNKFAGQELDMTATYDYTEDVQFSLMSGLFFPGTSFSERTDNVASELIGTMKVTF